MIVKLWVTEGFFIRELMDGAVQTCKEVTAEIQECVKATFGNHQLIHWEQLIHNRGVGAPPRVVQQIRVAAEQPSARTAPPAWSVEIFSLRFLMGLAIALMGFLQVSNGVQAFGNSCMQKYAYGRVDLTTLPEIYLPCPCSTRSANARLGWL